MSTSKNAKHDLYHSLGLNISYEEFEKTADRFFEDRFAELRCMGARFIVGDDEPGTMWHGWSSDFRFPLIMELADFVYEKYRFVQMHITVSGDHRRLPQASVHLEACNSSVRLQTNESSNIIVEFYCLQSMFPEMKETHYGKEQGASSHKTIEFKYDLNNPQVIANLRSKLCELIDMLTQHIYDQRSAYYLKCTPST